MAVKFIIISVGIVACVGYSDLTTPSMIWPAIIGDSSDIFKGFFVISLLLWLVHG